MFSMAVEKQNLGAVNTLKRTKAEIYAEGIFNFNCICSEDDLFSLLLFSFLCILGVFLCILRVLQVIPKFYKEKNKYCIFNFTLNCNFITWEYFLFEN